jgi:putative ABC transport system substrate-binding protein
MVAISTICRIVASAVVLILAVQVAAQAQQAARVYRVGLVSMGLPAPGPGFRQALRERGYIEGKNVFVEERNAEGRADRVSGLIAEVLALKIDVLVVGSAPTALAAKKATATVPIVFASVLNPVEIGLVASLARPGGNITGTTFGVGGEGFGGKWVELLTEAVPGISHVAVLRNAANPASAPFLREMQSAAQGLKLQLELHDGGDPARLEGAFAAIAASRAQAIIVTADPFFSAVRTRLIQFAAAKRLPAVYYTKRFADAGGLIAYGGNPADSFRRAAAYVDKILKGAKPADLPVEQPTKFELVINLKTAKALGLTIPRSLLLRADHVIE